MRIERGKKDDCELTEGGRELVVKHRLIGSGGSNDNYALSVRNHRLADVVPWRRLEARATQPPTASNQKRHVIYGQRPQQQKQNKKKCAWLRGVWGCGGKLESKAQDVLDASEGETPRCMFALQVCAAENGREKGDERLLTKAAIQMLQDQNAVGDWAHPHWPWGTHQAFSEVGWRYHVTERASRTTRAQAREA